MFDKSRFDIEKKLREAKKNAKDKAKGGSSSAVPKSVSERSHDRRRVIEDKKDSKKMSALNVLKARREEKKKQGLWFNLVQTSSDRSGSIQINLVLKITALWKSLD